jgi:hypothetical protein
LGLRIFAASFSKVVRAGQKPTDLEIFLEPSEKKERKNRRNGNFFANRLGKWSVKSDGMEIFLRTVCENGALKPTERKIFLKPSEK